MPRNSRLRVAVLFGGLSPEHKISIKSALFVLNNIDREKYLPDPIYILPGGEECRDDSQRKEMIRGAIREGLVPDELAKDWETLTAPLTPDQSFIQKSLNHEYDVMIPLFHGPFGEDGTMQGLFEIIGIPYTGCDVTGSAVTIDKELTKRICRDHGIPVTPFKRILLPDWEYQKEITLKEIYQQFSFPLFVKPARQGSSFGINRADSEEELIKSINHAFQFDDKIMVEKSVTGVEYAVGVLGNSFPQASVPAEFKLSTDFFDFDAKYGADAIDDVIPAPVSDETTQRLQAFAVRVFKALELKGIARIDCFIENGYILLNEINSLPGLGGHSVFNRIWAESGYGPTPLINAMIDLALEERRDFRAAARHLVSHLMKDGTGQEE